MIIINYKEVVNTENYQYICCGEYKVTLIIITSDLKIIYFAYILFHSVLLFYKNPKINRFPSSVIRPEFLDSFDRALAT